MSNAASASTTTAPASHAREALVRMLSELRATLVGDGGAWDHTARLLALHLAWYTQVWRPLRLLLVGPSGAGKTTLIRTLAESLGLPFVSASMTDLTETSWEGTQLADVLPSLIRPPLEPVGFPFPPVAHASSYAPVGVLHLDEVDKLALETGHGVRHTRASASWRLGRQESLLPLLDPAGRLQLQVGQGRGRITLHTNRLAVISSGAFSMADSGVPLTPRALIGLGLLPEFVDRLGWPLVLPPLHLTARETLVVQPLTEVQALEAALGLTGTLEQAQAYGAAPAAEDCAGPRGLAHWVATQTLGALATALATQALPAAPTGGPLVIPDSALPDDVPAPARTPDPEFDL